MNNIAQMMKSTTNILFVGLGTIALILALISCGLTTRPEIPPEALSGIEEGSAQRMGHLNLSDWTDDVPEETYLSLFTGKTADGSEQIRAFVTAGEQQVYLGPLTAQLGSPVVQTLFFTTGGDRFVIGYVSPDVEGHLLYFRMDRPEPDNSQWMQAVKESKIKGRVFLVPIFQDEADQWNSLAFAGVQTKESLNRGLKTDESYYEWEQTFEPPRNIENLFVTIKNPKQ